jgi:eukaryotic-like serine/threonine-protein kinase
VADGTSLAVPPHDERTILVTAERRRWDRVKHLFQEALERPAHERARFLGGVCGDDDALLQEVQSLLAAHDQAGEFAERPAIDVLVPAAAATTTRNDGDPAEDGLQRGSSLGPYEVDECIGRGGMGEVYRARDTRLGRTVALKVLPQHIAGDADRRVRFEREARTLAALSHPHICPIFDVGRQDGVDYLVMEFLEGETLASRLRRGPLPLDQVLRYGAEIADALGRAHRAGIVHRDVKPGNIMLTKSGARLLDFGLATGESITLYPGLANPSAQIDALTAQGTILGTLGYMAPEQAQGGDADARSDVFSLGAVVYEMVTGTRAFEGESAAGVIAAILEREPAPLTARQPSAPRALERVLAVCLVKDPDQRWQSAGDLKRELEWITSEMELPAIQSSPVAWRPAALLWALAGLALGVTVTGAWALLGRASRESLPVVRTLIPMPLGLQAGMDISPSRDLAVSPEGKRFVYAAGSQAAPLRIHAFDRLESEPVAGTLGASSPFFSQDGETIGFFDQRESVLKRVSIHGGPVGVIAKVEGLPAGASWGPDDTIVFATQTSNGLFRVPARGGTPERLTSSASGESHRWPSVLPNGRGVLFTAWRNSIDLSRIAVVTLDTGQVVDIIPGGSHAVYAPTGHLVYAAGGALRAIGFDPERLRHTSATPSSVGERVLVQATGAAQFDVADNGSLLYVPAPSTGTRPRMLVWIDRAGREEAVTLAPRAYGGVRVSPDGQRIAADIEEGGRRDIWVSNAARTTWSRLPGSPGPSTFGSWSPMWASDGQRLVFQNDVGRLVWMAADGFGSVEPLLSIEGMTILAPSGWTPEGAGLLFAYGTPAQIRTGLSSVPRERGVKAEWKPFLDREAKASEVSVSPTGGWMAYQSFDSGRYEVYVERFPQLGGRQAVSGPEGGFNAVWSRDGKELFYRRLSDGAMMSVSVRPSPFAVGTPRVLFADPGTFLLRPPQPSGPARRVWDVAPDGRFLMVKNAPGDAALPSPGIVHVQNWTEELKRLVPPR